MSYLHELRQLLADFQAQHERVSERATATNLQRLRWIAPTVVVVNLLHVLALAVQLSTQEHQGLARDWRTGLLLAHSGMGLVMAACALAVRRLDPQHPAPWARHLPLATVAFGMVFAIVIVAIDQWVTPNITPFLVSCLLISVVFHLRPLPSAVLYLLAFVGFYGGLGLTQINADLLFSNRLNGITIGLLGWVLMVVMWRNFTTITLQQAELVDINLTLKERQDELESLSRHDGLTGLFNRQTFVQLAADELARARRQGTDTSLLILDLDFFKRVNDTHGHPGGDAMLRHVAQLLGTTVRSTDLVGRLGGEEFMVLLPGTRMDAARTLAEKLRQQMETSPLVWQNAPISVTVSIGLACTSASSQAPEFEPLYHAADAAMYQAKHQGRNRVVVGDAQMSGQELLSLEQKLQTEADMRHAGRGQKS